MKNEQPSINAGRIRPDLRVGALARLAFETYFQSPDRQAQEIDQLQDGEYCHKTFLLNRTMPALVPVSTIEAAPEGRHVGERGFYQNHYYARPILEADGIKYRLVNDWKEPNPRDNRTPLEDWIRRMRLDL